MNNRPLFAFEENDEVRKHTGDYRFHGIIVARFRKLNGVDRYVVENEAGILHIFNASQLRKA